MRRAAIALLPTLALSGCFGVSEKHSTLVKPVPVDLVFQSTPTPSASPSATPTPTPTPTPSPARRTP